MLLRPISRSIVLIGLSAFGLAACGTVNDQLGLSKSRPDEFAVVRKAPLVLPPNYNLRPPRPGATGPKEQTAQEAGARAVFGADHMAAPLGASPGEVVLLNRAGAAEADARIRQTVDEETASIVEKSDSLTNKILFWQKPKVDTPLDPAAEAARLRTAMPAATPEPQAPPAATGTAATTRPVFSESGTADDPLAQSGAPDDPLAAPGRTAAPPPAETPREAETPAEAKTSRSSAGGGEFRRGGILGTSAGSGNPF